MDANELDDLVDMESLGNALDQVLKQEAFTFFVGWKSGKAYQLRRMELHQDVEAEFRQVLSHVVDGTENRVGLVDREPQPWSPDAVIYPETFLVSASDAVGEVPTVVHRPDEKFLEVLTQAEDLSPIELKDLNKKQLSIYGFAVGDLDNRIVFIRRANPRRGLGTGKVFGRYSDVLKKINEPVFAFDGKIDLILIERSLLVLSQNAFAMLFRDQEDLKKLVPKWGKTLCRHYPVEKESIDRIIKKANRDSRCRQRLESIVARGHLQGLERDDLELALKECELDPAQFLNDSDELCVEEADVPELLWFLNEDLYRGVISKKFFRSDKKSIPNGG